MDPSRTMMSTAAGISSSTPPRSSPTVGRPGDAGAVGIDELTVTGPRLQAVTQAADKRHGHDRRAVGDLDHHRCAPGEHPTGGDGRPGPVAAVAIQRAPGGVL